MTSDPSAIHDLIRAWLAASKAGDLPALLELMCDDVLFTIPGKEPFGKEAFRAVTQANPRPQFDGTCDIVELSIQQEWAWMRCRLRITVTPPGGAAFTRSGYTLSILKKTAGRWQIFRDANLLGPPEKL